MIRQNLVSLASGSIFGAGLAVSGMIDPSRVRAFLDVGGAWDPTLAFVMAGAVLAMALAWLVAGVRSSPIAAAEFNVPPTSRIDGRLISGAALFGVGWGLVGLCPGPAIAAVAIRPLHAATFVAAMALGVAIHRLFFSRTSSDLQE